MQFCKNVICLTCSAGGHLRELQLAIGTIPQDYSTYWLTLKTKSTEDLFKDKEHIFIKNLQMNSKLSILINACQSLFWVLIKRPKVIITTGAGISIATVFFAKKLLGTKIIFINSAADVTHASKTPIWIEKYADLFLVQWEEMKQIFPNSIYCGVL